MYMYASVARGLMDKIPCWRDTLFLGLLSDKGLYSIAGDIGIEWQQLGAFLGVPNPTLQQIKLDNHGNTKQAIFSMLRHWRDHARGSKEEVKGELQAQLERLGRRDIGARLLKEQVEGSVERVNFHSIVWTFSGVTWRCLEVRFHNVFIYFYRKYV